MWDLPGPGLEPVSPALAGGFLTTAPPGKPYYDGFLTGFSVPIFLFFNPFYALHGPLMSLSLCLCLNSSSKRSKSPTAQVQPPLLKFKPHHPICALWALARPKHTLFPWSPAASLLPWIFSHSVVPLEHPLPPSLHAHILPVCKTEIKTTSSPFICPSFPPLNLWQHFPLSEWLRFMLEFSY